MARRGKYFELLDFSKFGRPDVINMQAAPTARQIASRLGDGGFMSYGQLWPRIPLAIRGLATDEFIHAAFSSYSDDWKNAAIREAYTLLRDFFGGRGAWYPAPTKP